MVYRTIFNLNLLHAYFLDRGIKKYHTNDVVNELSDKEKEDAEKIYNSNDFIQVLPNSKTKEVAKNHKLLIRIDNKGIRVLVSAIKLNAEVTTHNVISIEERYHPVIKLSDDLILTFYIKATDNFFENYTDIIDRKENQLYYFSNINSTANNAFDAISNIETLDRFLITAKETRRLLYQLEKESEFDTINPKGVSIANLDDDDFDQTIYVDKIDEIETKVNNETTLDEEEQEIFDTLNKAISILKNKKVIGVIQLKMSGSSINTAFTEILNSENPSNESVFDVPKQCLLENGIDFRIYIENRKTHWRYHKKDTGDTFITENSHPLTKNGKIEIKNDDFEPILTGDLFFPNPTVVSITKEQQKIFSELYI